MTPVLSDGLLVASCRETRQLFFALIIFKYMGSGMGNPLPCQLSWSKKFPIKPVSSSHIYVVCPKTLNSFLPVDSRHSFIFLQSAAIKTATTYFEPRASFLQRSDWSVERKTSFRSNHTFIHLFLQCLPNPFVPFALSRCFSQIDFLLSTSNMQSCFSPWSLTLYCKADSSPEMLLP